MRCEQSHSRWLHVNLPTCDANVNTLQFSSTLSATNCGKLYCHEQSMNHISLNKSGLDVIQSHPWQLPTAHSFTFTSAVAYNCASTSAASLGPRPKTNPSTDHFQYCTCYTGSDICTGWGLKRRLIHRIFWSHCHIWSIILLLSGKGHTHYMNTLDIDTCTNHACAPPALNECSQIQKLMWLCIHVQHVLFAHILIWLWKKTNNF